MRTRFSVDILTQGMDATYRIVDQEGVIVAVIDPFDQFNEPSVMAEAICEAMNTRADAIL
jgi:hypothetical protein